MDCKHSNADLSLLYCQCRVVCFQQRNHVISFEPISKRLTSNFIYDISSTSVWIDVIGAFCGKGKENCTELPESNTNIRKGDNIKTGYLQDRSTKSADRTNPCQQNSYLPKQLLVAERKRKWKFSVAIGAKLGKWQPLWCNEIQVMNIYYIFIKCRKMTKWRHDSLIGFRSKMNILGFFLVISARQ